MMLQLALVLEDLYGAYSRELTYPARTEVWVVSGLPVLRKIGDREGLFFTLAPGSRLHSVYAGSVELLPEFKEVT